VVEWPDHAIEFGAALDINFASEAFAASPMCLAGHYMEPFLRVVRAGIPGKAVPITFDEPDVIGQVILPITGMSIAELPKPFAVPPSTECTN
jgi:hypothetical protein